MHMGSGWGPFSPDMLSAMRDEDPELPVGSKVLVDRKFGFGGGEGTVKREIIFGIEVPIEFDDEPGTWWEVPKTACTLVE